jgi:hypothetical protein
MPDITLAISGLPINNIKQICSTLPTGYSAKSIIKTNYPSSLTVSNIENKFNDRFDDPSYYYGTGGTTLVGG